MTNQPSIEQWIEARRGRSAELLEEAFEHLDPRVAEQLSGVMQMWKEEDSDWLSLDGNQSDGLSLQDLKQWSGQLREALVGNPHIERGANLRSDYINEGGVRYGDITKKIRTAIESDIQRRRYFGPTARQERYRACYTDGGVFYLGDNKTRQIEAAIPLGEIVDAYRNSQNRSEVWAYLREWQDYSGGVQNPRLRREWVFTDVFEEKRGNRKTINYDGKPVRVARDKVIFDAFVNTQIGWTFGAPHALNALAWARLYRDFLVNGKIMSDAMAQFAFQVTTKTKKGTENTSLKFASARGSGQTVVGPNDLAPLATAGKGYDFDSGRALASVVATAIGVSVIHLTSDPGTAGSSYGSAQTLDLPTRLSVESERNWNAELDLRVLRWMGAKNPTAEFNPLISATDVYREIQAIKLAWDTGLFEGTPLQDRIADILGIVEPGAVPSDVLTPNNGKTVLATKSASSQGGQSDDSGDQAGGAGQGQSTGAGKGPKSRDTRDDNVSDNAAN
ncbi:hypothetical protein G7068_16220 [Leucobacter viscericola]|uniref:Phage portal protein, SPP1 Gp6-like n=1 Tax=Leucobacter viscericola TaxID=2714935 RepID=A0A6G7XJ69_9MICO|nr:hypothetical protein [Leucobacter viscericola]QIK64520.1 hypothetical protein G7068_15855 [Leucobacter viscericola]QIK64593.1 hypothetical protein G7068_16220 [Leucobacter viscericola]